MRIVYLTTCFGTPSHTFIRREIRQLREKGVEVYLYGIRKDQHIAPDATDLVDETHYLYPLNFLNLIYCNLYYLLLHPLRYLSSFFACLSYENGKLKNRIKLAYHLLVATTHAKAIEKLNVSHIHAHFLNVSSSVTMFCSRLTGIPFSTTVHSAGERDLPGVIGIPMKLQNASKLLMISDFNIGYYDDIHPCREKSSVVRCGINLEDFPVRSLERQTHEPLRILAIGRFVEKKGFIYLIRAASLLKDTGKTFTIEILGNGKLEQELKAEVSKLNVGDCVLLPGFAPTDVVREKIKNADIVVVPSVTSMSGEMEGIPVVLMEAMATGTPVIASAHSGIPELVTADTGYLVPEKDEKALAKAIENYTYSEEKTKNARKLIEEQFNITHVVDMRIALFT